MNGEITTSTSVSNNMDPNRKGYIAFLVRHKHTNIDNKKKTLEDFTYSILRDLFFYSSCHEDDLNERAIMANDLNRELTGNVYLEDRDEGFTYTSVLQNKDYVKRLKHYLDNFSENSFKYKNIFEIDKKEYEYAINNYVKFDEWYDDLIELNNLIKMRYKSLYRAI